MESRIKRTQQDYSLAFKLSVVAQVEKGELTYKEAQCHYGIQGRSTVLVWLRKHGLQDWSAQPSRRTLGIAMPDQASKPLTPEQRIKVLETQLKEANEKAQLFEAMLEVLKQDYGVRVVKKPSGRCLPKGASKG